MVAAGFATTLLDQLVKIECEQAGDPLDVLQILWRELHCDDETSPAKNGMWQMGPLDICAEKSIRMRMGIVGSSIPP